MTQPVTIDTVWDDVEAVRTQAPLVHNITNYVVMNSTANALLAMGASPVMAHALEEVADMVTIAGGLVINIGTLSPDWVKAMSVAMQTAHDRGIPIVLDPVGVGATPYRTQAAHQLLGEVAPTVVRGNASEIKALVVADVQTKGVDSLDESASVLEAAAHLQQTYGSTVAVTGATDFVVGPNQTVRIKGGHPLMGRVTGLGCTASALCGAFLAVNPSAEQAAAHALAISGIVGEVAAGQAGGPGSLQMLILDVMHNLSKDDVAQRLRVDVHQ